MEESEILLELLASIIQQLPSLLTLLGCAVVALIRWKRHPAVSLILAGSLLFLFAHILVFATAFLWLPELLINRGMFESYSSQTIYTAMSLTYNAGIAIGFALLLTSIVIQRKRQLAETNPAI